ncbi:HlyD family secretion protein [Persephonella hydrogeniphila]|uniref:HlyD family secretion protein n=1 Tax=Persephonella hydrogeniphila TaxID=198703 RepID=A0A285N0F0_9AQUI|nr:HlyD family efflux transporter periplasmic adaptor subunit [Persephonella hydrogeniphila]SNZ02912.1 HlyD family secretion protein [Persephonella hydrogeniphila]
MNILKKYWIGFIALSLVVLASYFIYLKLNPKKLPPNLVMGTGRIDGDLVNINTKYPGRIKKLYVDEGDEIKKGQIIAEIKSDEYKAKLKAIEETIKAKQKEISAKEIELKILQESLPEDVKKAQEALKANKAVLSELKQNIRALEKVVSQDRKDYERFKRLTQKNLFPEEKLEKIKLKLDTDLDKLKALKEKEKQVIAGINSAKSTLNQAKTTLLKIKALEEAISGLKKAVNALRAQKRELNIIISELKIRSPLNGYVVDKVANKGEVIGAGMTVVTAINPDELYLKMFVDTIHNGKIKIGDKAVIFLDAFPDRPIPATVVKIAKRAEFTPKEVAVREDRIQRVYAVHLKPDEPNPLLKLGLPAIGVITLNGKGLPKSLNELPKL